jgi:hypothetical protein
LLPKTSRIVKPKKPKPEEEELEYEDDSETGENAQAKRGRHFLQQHADLVSDFDYGEDDDDLEFEDDFEEDLEEPEDELEFEEDEEENVNEEDYFQPGMILEYSNGAKEVILAIEERGLSDILHVQNMITGKYQQKNMPTGLRVSDVVAKGRVKVVGHVSDSELNNMIRRNRIKLNKE